MTIESAINLMLALLVFVAIPGPAIFATVARSLASGFRPAFSLIFGILFGDVFYLLVAILGMAAIGKTLGGLFFVVRMVGAIYLVWMGIQLWVKEPKSPDDAANDKEAGTCRNFFAGFTLTLGNPRAILFHLGFLPAFIDLSSLGNVDILLVVTMVTSVLAGTLTGYAYAADRARSFFKNRRAVRLMNRGAGTLLIGTGVTVAVRR